MNDAYPATILIIDDEPEVCWIVKKVLGEQGYQTVTAFNGEQGLDAVEQHQPHLVLLDLRLPGMEGLEVLRILRERDPRIPVIILSAFENVGAAVKAMKLGAYDYISKPLNIDEMIITLKNALQTSRLLSEVDTLKHQIARQAGNGLMWSCPAMQVVMDLVNRIARYDVTALIRGESGTGKELVAEYIHAHSPRAERPMVSIDCGALPESLVESELFGYEKGAFTGAHASKPGRFELANGGTLFLDEIGNLSLSTQIKLLRVLQERRLVRLAGKKEIDIDVRLITATNVPLEEAMRAGRFREDLFHRLNEFTVTLPPLRERGEEVELLARHFLERFNSQFHKQVRDFSPEAMEVLTAYAWPGNVRELMNTVKRAVVLAGELIETEHLPGEITDAAAPSAPVPGHAADGREPIRPLKDICLEVTRRIERETITRALQENRWNKMKTAKLLKINYKTLFNKMRELGI